jgi:hypothetical protein
VTATDGGVPGDAALLEAWELARAQSRPWRELTLLRTVTAGGDFSTLAALPIGERDRRLLELRTSLAGDRIECEVDCPRCGERLELELEASALRPTVAPTSRTVSHGGRRVRLRPPNSADVAACLDADDPEATMLERCTGLDRNVLGDDLRSRLEWAMAAMDPGADLTIAMECPSCGETWESTLDPASLAIEEVERHAERLLREVDQLARAYGWPEREVLALSPVRRRAYLGLSAQ